MNLAEQWGTAVTYHGEGPVWLEETGTVCLVDMLAGDVLILRADGPERRHVSDVVAAIRPRTGGGAVIATERGFAFTDADFRAVTPLADAFANPGVRMNDGGCDTKGRFYCGTMAYDATPGAAVMYRLNSDLSQEVVLTGLTVSNGIAWTPDGSAAYYVDTATQRIDVFELDESGALHARRPVVEIDPALGSPDGLTLDADGGIWVAMWDGGAVHGYSPDGSLQHVIELPARRPTACAFGGPTLSDLYITTSRFQLDNPTDSDGAIFIAQPGVHGSSPLPFITRDPEPTSPQVEA